MNIKRAKEEITATVRAYLARDEVGAYRIPTVRQRPILLMGPPGIGKTQIMEQIARELDVALVSYTITHHTRQSALGLPFIREKVLGGESRTVTEYTMSEILSAVYTAMEDTGRREGILFLDEVNCISETLAPMMLQFLQCKTFGNQPLPQGWVLVTAGNPPEYNKSVREFDIVTLDRVRRMDVEADYAVWKEYAQRRALHGAVLTYLELRPDQFYQIRRTAEGLEFVTARGWEDLSELLYVYEDLGQAVDQTVVGEYLQCPQVAADFAAYWLLYNKYRQAYRVEELLAGQWTPLQARELINLMLAGLSQNPAVDGRFLQGFRSSVDAGKLTFTRKLDSNLVDAIRELIQIRLLGENPAETGDAGTAPQLQPQQTEAPRTNLPE